MSGTADVEKLLADLLADDGHVIRATIKSFSELESIEDRDKAFHGLITLLSDSNPWFRSRAVEALGVLKDKRAVEPIIASLDDSDEEVGIEMIEVKFGALAILKDSRAIVPLINQLHRVDFKQAWDLFAFDRDALIPALIDALKNSNSYIRHQVVYLLGNLRHITAVEPLIAKLNDENLRVRRQVIDSLMWIGSPQAVPALMSYANDPEPSIRENIAHALGELQSEDAVPTLLAMLKDQERDVQVQAACALGKLGNDTGLEIVLTALAKSFKHRFDAVKAVRRLKVKSAISLLINHIHYVTAQDYLSQPHLMVEIAETLIEISDKTALEALRKLLKYDQGVRTSAQKAIDSLESGS